MFLYSQTDVVLLDEFPQVDESVAHTAQCGVDADSGHVCNFLERHVFVESQHHDLGLRLRQIVKQVAQRLSVLLFQWERSL